MDLFPRYSFSGLGIGDWLFLLYLPYSPVSLELHNKMEKALRSNFSTLFPRGYYFLADLIAVGGIFAPIISRQLKSGVTKYRFRLFLINYIHIYRGCLEIGFLIFCSSPLGEMLAESFINPWLL
jgi:hypothetical protein